MGPLPELQHRHRAADRGLDAGGDPPRGAVRERLAGAQGGAGGGVRGARGVRDARTAQPRDPRRLRSEEHTSELQSRENLVCRLLLEKKKVEYVEQNMIV